MWSGGDAACFGEGDSGVHRAFSGSWLTDLSLMPSKSLFSFGPSLLLLGILFVDGDSTPLGLSGDSVSAMLGSRRSSGLLDLADESENVRVATDPFLAPAPLQNSSPLLSMLVCLDPLPLEELLEVSKRP